MKHSRAGKLAIVLLALLVLALAAPIAQADPYSDWLTRQGPAYCMYYGNLLVQYAPFLFRTDAERAYMADTFDTLPFDSPAWNAWLPQFLTAMTPT